jgi:hypothetical protein
MYSFAVIDMASVPIWLSTIRREDSGYHGTDSNRIPAG